MRVTFLKAAPKKKRSLAKNKSTDGKMQENISKEPLKPEHLLAPHPPQPFFTWWGNCSDRGSVCVWPCNDGQIWRSTSAIHVRCVPGEVWGRWGPFGIGSKTTRTEGGAAEKKTRDTNTWSILAVKGPVRCFFGGFVGENGDHGMFLDMKIASSRVGENPTTTRV